jgi:hypothetical protein
VQRLRDRISDASGYGVAGNASPQIDKDASLPRSNLETTMIYIHIVEATRNVRSPFDRLTSQSTTAPITS